MGSRNADGGHHRFADGRPTGHVFQTVSSDTVPAAMRYEYWLGENVCGFEVAPPGDAQRRDFRATVTSLATSAGELHHAESDAFALRRTRGTIRRAPFEELSLLLLLEGRIWCTYDDDGETEVREGGFCLIDGSRPVRIGFDRHRFIQLDLSRPMLESAFSGRLPAPPLINAALARSGLAGLLRDHLCQTPKFARGLAPVEQMGLLDASEAFAVTTIQAAFSNLAGAGAHANAGLFAAAQRYIRRRLADRDLDPDMVAAAIGCSRSTLYRMFRGRGLTVQGWIRELRLQQLARLLQGGGSEPIYLLAQRCGLHDHSNLNQMFRRRFGISPRDMREQARQRRDPLAR